MALGNAHVRCSRKRVARLMRENGLRAKMAKRFRPATTDSKDGLAVAPNILNRNFQQSACDKVWLTDITYIPTAQGFIYLSAVLDLCSRKIVGWALEDNLSRIGPLRALEMAVQRRRPKPGLLHHSDRGSQYASGVYQEMLQAHGMLCSMSRRGCCYDNAPMESFFHTLKVELFEGLFESKQQAMHQLFEYIEVFYNRQRLHSSLGGLTPQDFEERLLKIA